MNFQRALLTLLVAEATLAAGASTKRVLGKSSKKEDGSSGGSLDPHGYKQVNTLLSQAYMQIIKDGQLVAIEKYNAGFGGPYTDTTVDPSVCMRMWDESEMPVGILAEAIQTGKFIWCFSEYDLGDPELGGIAIAENDNFLQGIKAGDYYGLTIDTINTLTLTMSLILGEPLCPEIHIQPATEQGIFFDIVDALKSNSCYASTANWYRQPYRDQVVDFTCPVYTTGDDGYGVYSLAGDLDLADVIGNEGEGVTFCSRPGSVQDLLIARSFPKATLVDVSGGLPTDELCKGTCQAIVEETGQALNSKNATQSCDGLDFDSQLIASPSSGVSVAAFTLRPVCSAV